MCQRCYYLLLSIEGGRFSVEQGIELVNVKVVAIESVGGIQLNFGAGRHSLCEICEWAVACAGVCVRGERRAG